MNLHTLAKAGATILALLLISTGIASAHPHVWIAVETEVLTGPGQEITGFQHKWTFDEMYSEFAVNGLDANGDGVYSEEELRPLGQTNIEALKDFEYFTFAFLGKEKLPLGEPAPGYRLEYKNKLLTLYFTLPLAAPVPREKFKEFSFVVVRSEHVHLPDHGQTRAGENRLGEIAAVQRQDWQPSIGQGCERRAARREHRPREQSWPAVRRARHDRLQVRRFRGKIRPKGAQLPDIG